MKIELDENDIKLIIAMLNKCDPTGLFANKLFQKIVSQMEKVNSAQVELREIPKKQE